MTRLWPTTGQPQGLAGGRGDDLAINGDEPGVLDYHTEFKTKRLCAPTPYRSSDHQPVVVGLRLWAKALLFLPLSAK